MYNPKSSKAQEFISHKEILDTLNYAQKNKDNLELIEQILEKAKLGNGLSHREAMVLLDCQIEEKNKEKKSKNCLTLRDSFNIIEAMFYEHLIF